jgi:predicted RNase H-like HicB family nuclease
MAKLFTLEYWLDDDWYVGRLKEVPGVFSQGETLNDLENNIREAYTLMMEDEVEPNAEGRQTKEIELAV